MTNFFEKRERFNKEREKYYREKSNVRLKNSAIAAIAVAILLLAVAAIFMDGISDTTFLLMRGCAGLLALIFVVLVAILVYRVNVAYFADKCKRPQPVQTVLIRDGFEIMGHRIDGYESLWDATESFSTPGSTKSDEDGNEVVDERPYISFEKPEKPIPGLHILSIYRRFPCFDSYDYAYENRYYRTFFLSDKPFTKEEITRRACLKGVFIPEKLPEWARPFVIRNGDSDEMYIGK